MNLFGKVAAEADRKRAEELVRVNMRDEIKIVNELTVG
jgi:hypothetical protein